MPELWPILPPLYPSATQPVKNSAQAKTKKNWMDSLVFAYNPVTAVTPMVVAVPL
jgi:hypothetical protein